MFVKTPTSSLTAGKSLVHRLWYRTKAEIKRLLCGGAPEVPVAPPSPITKLPQELVGMVISYFIYDKHSLLACSMTCYSWHTTAVSYLHYSLTIDKQHPMGKLDPRCSWPRPLRKSYELGLLPFVKRFRIRLDTSCRTGFTSYRFNKRTLPYFSALTNLQELGIDYLQIPSFMPNIHRCFGHFSPTLRFLALKEPRGSRRQILYFISLFPNLQDLKLNYHSPEEDFQETTADAALVPLSIPPLRGWLTLGRFGREDLVKDMIFLFGGLRFRHMDLFKVKCIRLLLDACAETLETLRLYPFDPYANNSASPQHLNLSRNKRLRTLETTAQSIDVACNTASGFLKTVLSSVTSPAPLDVVIIYRDLDLGGMPFCPACVLGACCWCHPVLRRRNTDPERHQQQLRVFREMHSVRDFRLVLCADVSDRVVEYGVGVLERLVRAGQLPHEPLIISERRVLRIRYADRNMGWSPEGYSYASAL